MACKGAVVITGASTGIGAACALHLDQLGFRVFAGMRRVADGDALRRLATGSLEPLVLDVTDAASIATARDHVTRAIGVAGLAGLVNNAGIAVAGMLEFLPLAALRKQLEVNVVGQVAVTQTFLPLLRQAHGRIINIGSVSGLVAAPFLGAYAASKFALEAITDSLRVELRPWGIEVSLIEPGDIQTPIWEKSRAAAEELLHQAPHQAHELYGKAMIRAREAAARAAASAIPAEVVAETVARALTARRPKTRYRVGQGVGFVLLLSRLVPDRLRDAWLARHMGLE
jgi:NAD(P)-dependent dehydrogenase (short-subunit alcohol dehydrogenase family)